MEMTNLSPIKNTWPTRQLYDGNTLAKSLAVAAIPAFAFACAVGTGGYNTTKFFVARGDIGYRSPHIYKLDTADASELTATKHISFTLDTLDLSVSDLARMLGVSRQSIYKWQAGENISAQYAEKLENLADAAEHLRRFDNKKIRELLTRKIEGKTFIEALASGQSASAFAQRLVVMVNREVLQRNRISERILKKPVRVGWQNEFSPPHLIEEG